MSSDEKAAPAAKADEPAEGESIAATPTSRLRLKRFLLLFGLAALLSLVGMIVLPHDKYLRYQALNDHVAPRAYWIYQRIHADPTAIDIAFIGTSRTGRSMHTKRLEEDLQQQGVTAKAANFFMYKTGRNMHYVMAKELLRSRKVRLLVLEMNEWEDRKPHPETVFLADTEDILLAPLVINLNYFSDLGRLPGRQVDLFFETTLGKLGLRKPDFVPPPYQGANLDISEYLQTLNGKKVSFDVTHSREEMEELRKHQEATITPPLLPRSLERWEYRIPRFYIQKIFELAQQQGTKVVFLYVPRYGGPESPPPYQQYAAQAPLITSGDQLQKDYRYWDDATHLNWSGSKFLTDYVAQQIVAQGYLEPTTSTAAKPASLAAH
jgi:hypothetical protein